MAILGFGKTQLRYDMLDMARNAQEAKRFVKCERIYHRSQQLAWDGKDVLATLLKKHGGIHVADDKKAALNRIFAIILWGELAAWKISAQLADRMVPLEAKMAATSQAFDEARHFYVMYDYLNEMGNVPKKMDRAPQALLDLVLNTNNLAYKLLGMQLMIETLALTIFQTVREQQVEPVLSELMRYFERDEARHVGLGMQYLPSMIMDMNRAQISAMITFQVRIMAWALWENKILEDDFRVLGIDPRKIIDRGRKKQMAALHSAFDALGVDWQRDRNYFAATLNGVVEVMFPSEDSKRRPFARYEAAWEAFWARDEPHDASEFDIHHAHTIVTVHGPSGADDASASDSDTALSRDGATA